jgi:glucose/arabinose dehydrogenase
MINVDATFSEAIQPSTLVLELRNSGGTLQPSQVSYDAQTRTARLDPNAELAGSQTFTVTARNARDLAGNQMAQVTWSFTTATPGFQDVLLPQSGLTNPVVMQFAIDGRIFVAEKSGRIFFYDNSSDTTPTLFADLTTNVHNYWDRGMLGMVLHPGFPTIPYVYLLYAFDAVPGVPPPRWGTVGAVADPTCPTPPGATTNGCVITGRLSRLNVNDFTGTPLGTVNEHVLIEDWWQQFPSHSIGSLGFGSDGALYVTGGDGASFNYTDYGPPSSPAGDPTSGDPANQGGALRSQDLRTSGDIVHFHGALLRIDPETGAALPDNPLINHTDPNARKIVAYGLRNPFRFTIKPGTSEVWVGDVGWSTWEEINVVANPLDPVVRNFGWPCYEGNARQSGYDSANLPICESLYVESPGVSGLTAPHYTYDHSVRVVANEACPTGSSAITGLAFYPAAGGSYPSTYNGALFFSDFSRDCIWAMRVGANGLPNPSSIVTIKTNAGGREGPVQLISGPGADIYYAGLEDSRLHRIRYNAGNQPPTAVVQGAPTSGSSPLTVAFNASSSSDPEGQALSYAWDLDGDGLFDDGTTVAPNFTYTSATPLAVTVRLRVTDTQGLSDVASIVITVNNTAPTPLIASPAASFTWKVGDPIVFSGSATDPEQGTLPASSLIWSVIMHHCPSNCHQHSITDFVGVSSGSFVAPDHEYPSSLELRLTAIDSGGLQNTTSVTLNPQTVVLTYQTNPPGLQLTLNAASGTAPFSRSVIVGSTNSISATTPQTLGGTNYQFTSWSDNGAQTHSIVAPAAPATYTATFTSIGMPAGLVAAYGMNEGSGGTTADWTPNALTGTISGATWSTQGKFGGALSFDGVNDWVTVADGNALDFTAAMTAEAWLFPTALGSGSWRNVLIKERTGGEVYNLYANADTNAPVVYVVGADNPGAPLDARGTSQLPLNTWSHLAVTYDSATLRLYVNGNQVGARAMAGALLTSTGALRIGGNSVWGEFFQGRIDEVRLYNRALSPSEISADMNTPVGGALPDTTPPVRSSGQPTGTLAAGTTQATLSLATNESATCRYATTAGVAYASMVNTFATTGTTSHSTPVTGLTNGTAYNFFVRCQDSASNANPDDFPISFSVAAPDTTPPVRSAAQPTGTLAAGTTQATLSLTTNENASCRYATTAGVAYGSMANTFATSGATTHSTPVTGLTDGTSYNYFVRCQDPTGNANTDDFAISFSVANPPPPDLVPPTVSMTAPANGATVSGSVTVSANASDNVAVLGVQFLLNGAPIGAEDTTTPYSMSWNSTSVANGSYQLSARARDTANQTTSTAVSVTVNNVNVGLVASYSFNEGTGNTLNDRTGTGHTGTISGAAWTTPTQGKFGSALSFDGVDDWVTVNDANDLDLTTGMTLEAWVFPTALGTGSWRNVVIKERPAGEVYNLYANTDANAPVVWVVRSTSPGQPLDAAGVATLPLNTWTHLAATYDGTTLRLFVNGTEVGSRAVTGALVTSTGVLRMGGNSKWGEYFQGRIDEMRIYNRALSGAEIQLDMGAPIQP